MIWDGVEGVFAVMEANFDAQMAAVIALKGLGALGLQATSTRQKRLRIAQMVSMRKPFPALGIYSIGTLTGAKSNSRRTNSIRVGVDYWAQLNDAEKVAQQAELAAEAVMRCADLIYMAAGGVYGGAEGKYSTTIEMIATEPLKGAQHWGSGFRAIIPVDQEDTGL